MKLLDYLRSGREYSPALNQLVNEAEIIAAPILTQAYSLADKLTSISQGALVNLHRVRSYLPITSDGDTELYIQLLSGGFLAAGVAWATLHAVHKREYKCPVIAGERVAQGTIKTVDSAGKAVSDVRKSLTDRL
jgi:hypothetical protein